MPIRMREHYRGSPCSPHAMRSVNRANERRRGLLNRRQVPLEHGHVSRPGRQIREAVRWPYRAHDGPSPQTPRLPPPSRRLADRSFPDGPPRNAPPHGPSVLVFCTLSGSTSRLSLPSSSCPPDRRTTIAASPGCRSRRHCRGSPCFPRAVLRRSTTATKR